MKTKDGFGCQKCEAYSAEEVILNPGEVVTRLCASCRNLYRDFIESLPEHAELSELRFRGTCIQVSATGVRDPYEELKPMNDRAIALTRGPLRAAAEQWLTVAIPLDGEAQSVPK